MNATSENNVTAVSQTPSIRQMIWSYLQHQKPCLIKVAEEIARGSTQPHAPTLGLPPLNFLANAEPPSNFPHGLSGCITSPTVNGLAAGKQSNAEGFAAQTTAGLGILFGTWSDYCLYCWAKWAFRGSEESLGTLILARDHGALQDILGKPRQGCAQLIPGVDWGEMEVRGFYQSSDPSTRNLFTSIYRAAKPSSLFAVFGQNASIQAQQDLEQFIAEKRLFAYNVWPWFRSGTSSTTSANIHANLHQVAAVKKNLSDLIQCLSPEKIAGLGSWSWEPSAATPIHLLQNAYLPNWFKGRADVFRHPSAYSTHGWQRVWQNPSSWGGGMRWGGKTNSQAFQDFIR